MMTYSTFGWRHDIVRNHPSLNLKLIFLFGLRYEPKPQDVLPKPQTSIFPWSASFDIKTADDVIPDDSNPDRLLLQTKHAVS